MTMTMRVLACAVASTLQCVVAGVMLGQQADEPNPPSWPGTVHVFGPEDTNLTDRIAELLAVHNDRIVGHYTDKRIALLFKPGNYSNVTVFVGYYVQVLGLGEVADDVRFLSDAKTLINMTVSSKVRPLPPGIHCLAMGERPAPGSLDVFWRGAENFRSDAPTTYWAVSQAAPIRRVHAAGNLHLFDEHAYASGGYMADMQVDGQTQMGGQQQWFTRNSKLRSNTSEALQGAWSMVFVGVEGAPPARYPHGYSEEKAITNVAAAHVIAEKPFISINAEGKFTLWIPPIKRQAVGPQLNVPPARTGAVGVPFEKVFVARDTDSIETIQDKLDAGLHVVLSAGEYKVTRSLTIKTDNQVLLGIGMATLVAPSDGSPIVKVNNGAKGVRVAGLMLSAARISKVKAEDKSTLVEVGDYGVEDDGDMVRPCVLTDIFARVGGPDLDRTTSADIMVRINTGNVIGDNLWLWRADHAELNLGVDDPVNASHRIHPKSGEGLEYHLTLLGEHHSEAGLEVNGRDVTMYGLFVEHTVGDMTVWNGEGGRVYFYQSELPYDVTQESFCDKYSGYVVADHVKSHEGYGIGIYTYFRDYECVVKSGIRAPETDGVRFVNIFARYLNGESGVAHLLNQRGERVDGSCWWNAKACPQPWRVMWRIPDSLAAQHPAEKKSRQEIDECGSRDENAEHQRTLVIYILLFGWVLVALGILCYATKGNRPQGGQASQTEMGMRA